MTTQTDLWLDKKFDQLYAEHPDPWGCYAGRHSLDNKLFVDMLFEQQGEWPDVLDIGCGLGGLTNQFHARCASRVIGIDVSPVAVNKARDLFPWIRFEVRDIAQEEITDLGPFDLIVMSEVLWYVSDKLEEVLRRARAALLPNGRFAIHQFFPHQQQYYKEHIDGVDGFLHVMQRGWDVCRRLVSYHAEGQVLLALFQPKQEETTDGK